MSNKVIEKLTIVKSFIKYRYFISNTSRKKIEKRQNRLEKKIHKFVKSNSQYYKEKSDFGIMDKTIMMNNFNQLNTVGLEKDKAFKVAIDGEKSRDFSEKYNNITIGLSSGTSGNRGLFIASNKERNRWAGAILAKTLPKKHILHHKIAFFMRADSNLYQTISSKSIQFMFFDMYKDMSKNIEELNTFNPTILVSPPSALHDIAKAVEKGILQMNPKKIISVAEVLEEKDKEYFKRVFKKDVIHQIYQCTEGFLASTCEYGTLHMNEDIVKIEKEYIGDNRFLPIITDLERTSQPIIKYRLNDILIEKKEDCPCGSKHIALDSIEGRTDDIFIFEDDFGKDVPVFSDFIRRCILFVEGITDYKVVQVTKDKVDVYLSDINDDVKTKIINEFKNLCKDLKCKVPTLNFKTYKYDYSKKMKRVERKL